MSRNERNSEKLRFNGAEEEEDDDDIDGGGRDAYAGRGSLYKKMNQAAREMDYNANRMIVVARHVEAFIKEFFDQNPLSQVGLSPESHIKALMGKLTSSGDASLQNGLDLVHSLLNQIPTYGHREVLMLSSALSTCDPCDVLET